MQAMSPRLRRLYADLQHMTELVDQNSSVEMRSEGNPPETYHLMINTAGLSRGHDGQPVIRNIHRCTVYLHSDYPRRPPVVTWLTPVLHPNILPPERNGGVCIGAWSASESLADLVRRLVELVSYRSFNIGDSLDKQAAAWVAEHNVQPGSDLAALIQDLATGVDKPFEVVLKRG